MCWVTCEYCTLSVLSCSAVLFCRSERREWSFFREAFVVVFFTATGAGGQLPWMILKQNNLRLSEVDETILYTGCHRRNGPNFGRVFLMLNYTDITQNTYIQSWTVTEIMAREKCEHLAFPRTVRLQLCSALTVRLWRYKLRPAR